MRLSAGGNGGWRIRTARAVPQTIGSAMKNNKNSRKWLHLGIRARLMCLALAPILGLVAVLLVERYASARLATAEVVYNAQRESVAAATILRNEIASMRIAADGFRAQRDKRDEAAFAERRESGAAILQEMARGLDNEALQKHAGIRTSFESFGEDFAAYVKIIDRIGRTNADGLLGEMAFNSLKLKGIIGGMDSEFKDWAGGIRDAMFELFLAERDFRIFQSNAFIAYYDKMADSVDRMIKVAQVKPASQKEVDAGLDAYKDKFSAWSDAVQLSLTIFNRLNASYLILGQQIDKLQGDFEARMASARIEQSEIARLQRVWVIGAFACAALISAALALGIGIGISRDTARLSTAMHNLAGGDVEAAMPRLSRRDEIGAMSEALTVLRDGVRERHGLVAAQQATAGERLERAKEIEDAIRGFETTIGVAMQGLHAASETMRQVSGELDAAAVEAEAQAISAAGDTDKAAGEIEAAAVAAQQLASSVDEVASQALRSDQAASEALRDAEKAQQAMAGLVTQAERVGEIVGMISGIAAQTNLLALNATIEAARAGEAGRGFAVVASEVKDLAAQTAAATNEIAGQIAGIREASSGVMDSVQAMNGTIAEVSRIATSVAAAVEQQSAQLSGISGNIVAASEGAARGATGIRTVETAVADTARNAARVRETSEQLSVDASRLDDSVAVFLNGVRAA
jgi:methyl-accepting chemotaxis protein